MHPFEVVPTPQNQRHSAVAGAYVHCVILEGTPEAARGKAGFFVAKYDWEILSVKGGPAKVTEDNFEGKDLGLELYRKAQAEGMAFSCVAWSRDGKSSAGPTVLEPTWSPILPDLLRAHKKASKTGRCLHFDGDVRCGKIVNAHSIQKSRFLSSISERGHVYVLSADIGTLNRTNGFPAYSKAGIKKVSTFMGFCQRHDNELFAPIDNGPLEPTDEQAALYAYRSLCREYFVKENASVSLGAQPTAKANQSAITALLDNFRAGNEWGFFNLQLHKDQFDKSLRSKAFKDIRYVLFACRGRPTVAFSGLLYPDYDFEGMPLQNLADHSRPLELITMCTAPMASGWGFLFAWHQSSSRACTQLIRSLASVVHQGANLGDYLFRMAIATSENLAISPEWLDSLSSEDRDRIWLKAIEAPNSFVPTKNTYLCEGLEGISKWEVDHVFDCTRRN